jgi:hypothetical protein
VHPDADLLARCARFPIFASSSSSFPSFPSVPPLFVIPLYSAWSEVVLFAAFYFLLSIAGKVD